jgi:Sugar-transfer associated ATP-grasp
MIVLWLRDGIDPPTYYQMEMFRPGRIAQSEDILTRYETKNGVLSTLNKARKNSIGGDEMGNKHFFAEFCENNALAHVSTLGLATVEVCKFDGDPGGFPPELFCKPKNGKGAIGASRLTLVERGMYVDSHKTILPLNEHLMRKAKENGRDMLLQPFLENHENIADLAKHSLLAFRVITCRNTKDEVEVTMAMLRLLTKLEPDWSYLPDGEYAASIDISTGSLGELLGDDCANACVHWQNHPVSDAPIAGRIVDDWPRVAALALRAHNLLPHRVAIGWDIALTPAGPVLIEGNQNFDVMFLQRVAQRPLGQTRLGELLVHHMQQHLNNSLQ